MFSNVMKVLIIGKEIYHGKYGVIDYESNYG